MIFNYICQKQYRALQHGLKQKIVKNNWGENGWHISFLIDFLKKFERLYYFPNKLMGVLFNDWLFEWSSKFSPEFRDRLRAYN
jgi:hypothetical protein